MAREWIRNREKFLLQDSSNKQVPDPAVPELPFAAYGRLAENLITGRFTGLSFLILIKGENLKAYPFVSEFHSIDQ